MSVTRMQHKHTAKFPFERGELPAEKLSELLESYVYGFACWLRCQLALKIRTTMGHIYSVYVYLIHS